MTFPVSRRKLTPFLISTMLAPVAFSQDLDPIPRTALEILAAGGVLMIPIALCSVIAFGLIVERLMNLRRNRIIPPSILADLKESVQTSPCHALDLCDRNPSPIGSVLAAGLRKIDRGEATDMEKAMEDAGHRMVSRLERNVKPLAGIANIATLLGLMGTVLGMIKAFSTVAHSKGLGRPELLAEGISEALLTTAAGLSVAIPTLIMFYLFNGRIDALVYEVEELCSDMVDGLPRTENTP